MTVALLALLVVAAGVVVAMVLRRLPVRGMDDAVDSASFAAPPPGSLTAADVDDIRFDQAFRGYRMGQVDEMLDRVREHLVVQEREIDELRRSLESGTGGIGGALAGPAADSRRPVSAAGDHDHTAPFDSLHQAPWQPPRRPASDPAPAPDPVPASDPAPGRGPGAVRSDPAWSDPAWSDPERPDPAWSDPARSDSGWSDPARPDSGWSDPAWSDPGVPRRPPVIPGPSDRWVDDRDETRWFSQAHRAGLGVVPEQPRSGSDLSRPAQDGPAGADLPGVGADPSWPPARDLRRDQPDPSWPPLRRDRRSPDPSPAAGPAAGRLEPQRPQRSEAGRGAFTPPPAAEAFSGIDLTPGRPRRHRG